MRIPSMATGWLLSDSESLTDWLELVHGDDHPAANIAGFRRAPGAGFWSPDRMHFQAREEPISSLSAHPAPAGTLTTAGRCTTPGAAAFVSGRSGSRRGSGRNLLAS